jgi:osmotically inducible lipoprotein OsmB
MRPVFSGDIHMEGSQMNTLTKIAPVLAVAALLSACGTTVEQRAASGGLGGAAAGALIGGNATGAVVGGVAGAAVGAATAPDRR